MKTITLVFFYAAISIYSYATLALTELTGIQLVTLWIIAISATILTILTVIGLPRDSHTIE